MKISTLVSVAHAGGQGKTTVAQMLYLAAKKAGFAYKMVSADFVDQTGRSKLGKLYPDKVEEFGVGAQLNAARTQNNANAAVRYWDRIGHVFLEGGHVIDVGANVIPSLIDWALDRHLSALLEKQGAPKIEFFCVCKAERHAVDDMAKLIARLSSQRPFRNNRFFIVKNEVGGSFDSLEIEKKLTQAFPNENIVYLDMPKCQSEIWQAMEAKGTSIEQVLDMDEDQAVAALDVDIWTASAGLAEMRAWFDNTLQVIRGSDVLPRVDSNLVNIKARRAGAAE